MEPTISSIIRDNPMSLGRFAMLIFTALAIFGVLYLLAGKFLGPGLGDAFFEIANGYMYFDAGGYEKSIDYKGNERQTGTVIDARVDDYRVDGDQLLVARRPRVIELGDDDALRSHLLLDCEYWVIELNTHAVRQVTHLKHVQCR